MNSDLAIVLITGALVGAASGFLGSFMVLKRMALVGDALSHVALPGLAIAMLVGVNPMLGALTALTMAVFGIWYLGEKTEVYSEALVGIFFTASLAIGILVTPEPELLEALFGNIETIGIWDAIITILAAILIYAVTALVSKRIVLGIVSESLAKSTGVNVSKVNLMYLLMVGLVVALGVKFVGTLLTGALVIVPAAAAKNIAKNIRGFQYLSAAIGLVSVVAGILTARYLGVSSGPLVVLVSAFFFTASFLFVKK